MCQKKLRSQHSLTYTVLRVKNGHWSDTFPSNQACGIELVICTNIGSNPLNAPQCRRVTYIKSLYFCTLRSVELVNFTDVTEITRTINVGLVS